MGNLQPDGTHKLTIPAGVTLILPYLNGTNTIGDNGTITGVYHNSDSASTAAAERNPMGADAISLHRKNCDLGCTSDPCIHEKCSFCTDSGCNLCITKVVLNAGAILQVNGTMVISGQLDGGGAGLEYTGGTSGYYAELKLEAGARVEVNGTLHVPGFITESTSNNGSIVKINELGTVFQPFVVRDFKGGTVTGAIYNSITDGVPYAPFNEFCAMNIYATMHIYGSVTAYANIYANSQHNSTVAPLIGLTSNSFIQLSSNAYAIADFDLETEILTLDIYGGARTNSFRVAVNTPLGVKTMTSQQFIFPISWMYDIRLHNGSYNMSNGNRFKLLPGGKLTVGSDAKLRISYLNVYESFDLTDQVESYCAKYKSIPAVFTVDGSVTITDFGGKIYTTNDGASVTVINSTSLTTQEAYAYPSTADVIAGVVLKGSGRVSNATPFSFTSQLLYKYVTENSVTINTFTGAFNPATRYESVENGVNSNWKRSEYISITIEDTWNVTGITGALVMDAEGNPVDANGDGVYDTYTPASSEIANGATFFFNYSGGTITFQLADREMLMKDGSYATTIGSLPNVSGVRSETWDVTVSETISITKLPTLNFTGNTSKVTGASTVTYVDNGDGTCSVSLYLRSNSTSALLGRNAAEFTATVTIDGVSETYTPEDHKNKTLLGREYIEYRDLGVVIPSNATIAIS